MLEVYLFVCCQKYILHEGRQLMFQKPRHTVSLAHSAVTIENRTHVLFVNCLMTLSVSQLYSVR
jgi:hypothetical protein